MRMACTPLSRGLVSPHPRVDLADRALAVTKE
jgi:hypothetical protein